MLPIDGSPSPAHQVIMAIDREDGRVARRSSPRKTSFWKTYHAHRYMILFYTLMFTLVAMPVAAFAGWNAEVLEILLGATLLTAVMPLGDPKRRFIVLGVILLVLAARPVAAEVHQQGLSDTALGLWAVIGLLAAAGALRFALMAEEIHREHIYAALSAYLLAGIFLGMIYWSVEMAWPGSFTGPSEFTRESAVYFSFVTLATLGYGDFLPKTDMARGIVIFQVIGGQLFLAVMVARLIGLYIGDRKPD
jgi:hypothetical protein